MGLRAEKENRSLICEASRRTRPQDELWRRFVSNYRTCCRPPHLRLICFISSLKGNQCGVKDQTVSLTAAALCSINFTSCTFSLKLTSAVYRPPAVEERISSNDLQNVLCFTQSWAVVHDWQRDGGGRTEGLILTICRWRGWSCHLLSLTAEVKRADGGWSSRGDSSAPPLCFGWLGRWRD